MSSLSFASRSDFATLVLKASHQCATIRAAIRCVRRIDDHELFCVVKKSREPIVEKLQQAMGLVGQAMKLPPSPDLTMDGFRVEALRDSVALEQFLSSQAALNEELAGLAAHPALGDPMNAAA